jgi:hypothetical protein
LADAVSIGLGVHTGALRSLNDLVSVLIRSGEKEGLAAQQPMKSVHDVRDDGGIGVTNVGFCVDIVDWGGDVEMIHCCLILDPELESAALSMSCEL